MKKYSFSRNLGYAVAGIWYGLKTQIHLRFHLLSTIGVLLLGFFLQLSVSQWLWVILAVTLVWMAELINTAVEAVVDLVTQQQQPLAKAAKDVAAGATLVAAIYALVVATLILLPKIYKLIT